MTARSMGRTGFFIAGVIAAFALVACGGGDAGTDEGDEATEVVATEAADATAEADGEGDEGEDDVLVKGTPPGEFFATNCAVCHGAKREGGVGLPLTPDKLTKDDGFYQDTIKNGRSGTAMAAMGQILGLSDDDLSVLVRFLKTDQP